jgi:hypothetical protein
MAGLAMVIPGGHTIQLWVIIQQLSSSLKVRKEVHGYLHVILHDTKAVVSGTCGTRLCSIDWHAGGYIIDLLDFAAGMPWNTMSVTLLVTLLLQ